MSINIRPSASIRQNYNEIANLCRKTEQPVFLTKNGEGDLVVMDIATYSQREAMLKLREDLLSIEESKQNGEFGTTIEELESELQEVIESV